MNSIKSTLRDILLIISGSFIGGEQHKIPIITYHSIDKSGSSISKSSFVFAKEIALLKQWDFETISFEDLLSGEGIKASSGKRQMIITFDDGYENNLTEAIPILEAHDFTASIFMTTGLAGGTNNWKNHPSVPELKMLSGSMIKEAEDRGFSVYPHTALHKDLSALSEDDARIEIESSIDYLETLTGKECRVFCFPYGKYNETTLRILKELGIKAAVTTDFGKNEYKPAEPLLLKRIGSAYFTSAFSQKVTLTGRYERYQKIKRFLPI